MSNDLTPDQKKLLSIIFAFLFPPFGVLLNQDFQFNRTLLISCILTLLGYFPGAIYALYVIFR